MQCTADNTSIRNASPSPGACDSYHCMASSSSISAICRNRTGTAGICDDFVQIFGCELTAAPRRGGFETRPYNLGILVRAAHCVVPTQQQMRKERGSPSR